MNEKAYALGELVATLVVGSVIAPLLLVCGFNWLLEAAQLNQLPYTLGTWFGAWLITGSIKVRNSTNKHGK